MTNAERESIAQPLRELLLTTKAPFSPECIEARQTLARLFTKPEVSHA